MMFNLTMEVGQALQALVQVAPLSSTHCSSRQSSTQMANTSNSGFLSSHKFQLSTFTTHGICQETFRRNTRFRLVEISPLTQQSSTTPNQLTVSSTLLLMLPERSSASQPPRKS